MAIKSFPKPHTIKSPDFTAFIHEFPCEVCGKRPVESAHTGQKGLSQKSDDFRQLPLCSDCHRGPKGLDSIGPVNFEKLYSIDIKERVIYYMREFCIRAGLFK